MNDGQRGYVSAQPSMSSALFVRAALQPLPTYLGQAVLSMEYVETLLAYLSAHPILLPP